MGLFDALDASGSALSAERVRMDVTAENLANAQSTRTANGQGPYRRKEVVLQEAGAGVGARASFADSLQAARGVKVAGIVEDPTPSRRVYDPGHPDADAQGYVAMPNVNTVTEMTDLIGASRAYEANVTAMQTTKAMFARTLDLLK
jgi:flagellar basal-body rod protein FlgC